MTALIIAAIVVVGALIWWRIDRLEKRIDRMDERQRVQIDSYGATVGELVDYVNSKE